MIGALVDKGIRLQRDAVVTTTWGEWRRRHPDTRVLSLDTGHQRAWPLPFGEEFGEAMKSAANYTGRQKSSAAIAPDGMVCFST